MTKAEMIQHYGIKLIPLEGMNIPRVTDAQRKANYLLKYRGIEYFTTGTYKDILICVRSINNYKRNIRR